MSLSNMNPKDPSSFSRPDLAVVTNIFLSLDINFGSQIFSGNVDLTVKKNDATVNEVVLDSRGLNIEAIYEMETNKKLNYTLSEPSGDFGSKLTVELPPKEINNYVISVKYETSPNSSGLQWLSPEQTSGKRLPYVFSQFQPIHARSVLPCQDTPSVKTRYSAVISAPSDFIVRMSAICDYKKQGPGRTFFHFSQGIPIPSSLIAFAVGALESRQVGPRTTVWAEKEVLKDAALEFSDTERVLQIAEDICGPYEWGIYDLLVMPPSFPLGGMENPCLTFFTPTLLAGDKSVIDGLAHEIAHSWTGNLVTNSNFEHFWLNEGFTVFIERKILGRLMNTQLEDFSAYMGLTELKERIDELGVANPLTQLVVNLEGVNPDDAYSIVPYEKGYIFLRYLQNIVGGSDAFEPFLRDYINNFKYRSLTTDDFKSFFEDYFKTNDSITQIDWNTWMYSPGMPPVIPEYDQTLRKVSLEYVERFLSWDGRGEIPLNSNELIPDQVIQILQELVHEKPQDIEKLQALHDAFKLGDVKSCEIKFRWLRMCLKARWEGKIRPAIQWLNTVGRMKYTRPLYRDLFAWDVSRPLAVLNYEENRKYMMHVCAYTIGKDLELI